MQRPFTSLLLSMLSQHVAFSKVEAKLKPIIYIGNKDLTKSHGKN